MGGECVEEFATVPHTLPHTHPIPCLPQLLVPTAPLVADSTFPLASVVCSPALPSCISPLLPQLPYLLPKVSLNQGD